jgi:IS5 family transposase
MFLHCRLKRHLICGDGMKPRERRETGQSDLFKARLDAIIDMSHPRVRLAQRIDWGFLEGKFGAVYSDGPGSPPLPTRLMAGLHILKYSENLSDERLCEIWAENPYFQYFCDEEFFQHALAFDRSSLTRWRQRMGEDKLNALLQESLAVALKTKALEPSELTAVVVDTTVQPKNVAHPTDAKLLNRARERLVRLATKHGVRLRQSYARVGKRAFIKQQRYAHAKQFKRANRALRTLKTYLGRVMRDIGRKIKDDDGLKAVFAQPLSLSWRVLTQKKRQDAPKVYALHAPEVECIGKGKAHKPYEFGVKVSLATTVSASKGGQFILHATALPGNPYDGHTLKSVLPGIEAITGAALSRILADAGYKGHNALEQHKFKVYTQGQKRGVTAAIRRQFKRRAGIEPLIGHCKEDHRMDRNFLAHREGDAINATLAAAGYNFRRLLGWLELVLRLLLQAFMRETHASKRPKAQKFTAD